MYKVTKEQIDYILEDINKRGVVLEDLQNNLLDHICCIIENEMSENEDFNDFYEQILPRFFKRDLKEIQEETNNLLTFKHYYAMKNTLKISGIISAILTLLGAVLKTFHLPGAGVAIVLGTVIFSLIFLPLMIALKFKDEARKVDKWILSLGLLLGIGLSLGTLFKLMHWPYANFLMQWSLTFFVFGYVPLYFISRYRRAELRFNVTVNSVLMMATGGMLYALFNLNVSHNFKQTVDASYQFLNNNTEKVMLANAKLYSSISKQKDIDNSHYISLQLINKIEDIKVNLIALVENISIDNAKKLSLIDIKQPDNHKIVNINFDEGKDEFSLSELLKEINAYNSMIIELFPDNNEKVIDMEKLQLENNMLTLLLFNLSQIQLQIATNENSQLNYAFVNHTDTIIN